MSESASLVAVVLAEGALVGDDVEGRLAGRVPGLEVRHVPYVLPREESMARRLKTVAGEPHEPSELSDELSGALADADAVIGFDVPHDLANFAPNARFVQAVGAGTEQYNVARYADDGITLCNAAGIAAPSIAEFIIGRTLEAYKDNRRVEMLQTEHRWRRHRAREFAGSTVAIIGLGAIGRATAQRLKGWEVTVLATRRRVDGPDATDPDVDELFASTRLDEVLPRADVVVVTLPATPETDGMFNAQTFAQMKPGVVFCNVSRGSMVDQPALIAALESGQVGAAILDVTTPEPLPADNPLWDAPNIFLSPHSSTSTDRYSERMLDLFAENLRRLGAGEELKNIIDPVLHYRIN